MPGNRSSSRELGPYELLETLGSGSSAKVYRARNKFLGTQVAMKVLHTRLLNEQAQRFLAEARIVAHLEHPNIVRVLGFDVEQSIPYLVMDFAPLGSLRQRHPLGTRLPLAVVIVYVKQVASALQYAHDRGETHLDVKPENMLLGKHGEVLLSDFGIAGKIQLQNPEMRRSAIGTIPYMAPEQILRRPGKASDQYALAIIVYEWLVGFYPFMGSREEIAHQHLTAQPPSLCARNSMVPQEVEEVVMKALAKDPKQRYSSVSAFAFALEKASSPMPAPRDPQARLLSPPNTVRQVRRPSRPNTVQRGRVPDAFLLISCGIVSFLLLSFILWSLVAAIVHPVNVTITPISTQFTQNETLVAGIDHADPTHQQVQARFIRATSPPITKMVKATGVGQTPGKQAQGYLTFYNGLPAPQTIRQGTDITAQDGIVVVTSIAVTLPPANPPTSFGTVTIPAQALHAGADGNIPGGAINESCCSGDGSISVKNLTPFSGGEDPQPYTYVQQSDIQGADAAVEPALKAMVQQALQKQVHKNEASAGPMRCLSHVYPDHAVNSRTASFQLTVNLQCTEEVYDKAQADYLFGLQLKNDAARHLDASYVLSGMIAVQLLPPVIRDDPGGSILLRANVSGIWAYQFSGAQKQNFLRLIDGKKANMVNMLLSKQPGVATVDIQSPAWVPWFIQEVSPINARHVTLIIARVT